MIRRLLTAFALLALMLALIAGVLLHRTYGKVREWSEQMYAPLVETGSETPHQSPHQETEPPAILKIDSRKPFALLFIGVDRRQGDRGRADALILAAINPQKRSTVMVSIPRDTRTRLVSAAHEREDKINHSYAFDGVSGTVATVEQFLNVSIDYYIQADMEGFKEVVDSLGGVHVHNDLAFTYERHTFDEGVLFLTGEDALKFVRMRYDDPKGDLGRGDRQKAVMRAMVDRMLEIGGIGKLSAIFDEWTKHVKTNMTFDDWKTLALHYRDAAETIGIEHMAGRGEMISGIYYYQVSEQERTRISQLLHDQLTPEERN